LLYNLRNPLDTTRSEYDLSLMQRHHLFIEWEVEVELNCE
jgi:hypothetical protein